MVEKSGILFAYLGAGRAARLSAVRLLHRAVDHTFAFKGMIECNWLQSLEVGIDPVHTSFLHRFFEDEDPDQATARCSATARKNSDMPMTQIMREFPRPRIEVEPTDYGFRLITLRQISERQGACARDQPGIPPCLHHSDEPRDDDLAVARAGRRHEALLVRDLHVLRRAVDKDEMRRQRLELYELPDYVPRKNKSNDYGFDPHEQEHATFTGMGADINVHDQWACEFMGAIQDRTAEHLGTSDKAISAYRRLLRRRSSNPARAAADDGARCGRGRDHRPGLRRRHRPGRRLAELLATHQHDRQKTKRWTNGH